MKKRRLIFVCIAIACCCAFLAFGGEKTQYGQENECIFVNEYACDVEISPSAAVLGTLTAPENPVLQSNGVATFDSVENADFYYVRLSEQTIGEVFKGPTSSTTVDLSEYILESAGTYFFDVMAYDGDGEYSSSEYSVPSNTISTVPLTIEYLRAVDEAYPTSAVGLVGKKYVDCLKNVDVSIENYDIEWLFDDDESVGDSVVESDRLALKVKYSGKPYTVKFVTNGGLAIADMTLYYNADSVTPIGTCGTQKEGFSFVGWCFNNDLSDTASWTLPAGTFGEITLYAKWKIDSFEIATDILSNCNKEYDGFGVSFRVTMNVAKSPYVNYSFNWYKDGFDDANLVYSSSVVSTFTTDAGIDASGEYFVKVIAQNPNDINDVFTKQIFTPLTVTITKCTPLITSFGTPTANGLYGDKLSDITLQGLTANASGSVVFDNPDMSLIVGKHFYSVTFIPDDTDNYNEVHGTVEINTVIPKDKRILEIEFTVPENMVENGEEYVVSAIATNLEGDDEITLLLSNNVQTRAGKYKATVIGMDIVKAEYFDYQLPDDGLSCDFEIMSAQIRTPDEPSANDMEGTFVDDNGAPSDAVVRIASADFDVFGLVVGGNQKVIGKFVVDVTSGDVSLDRTGKVSVKINDFDFENSELYVKTDDGFEKLEFSVENGRVAFNAHTPAQIVIVGEMEAEIAPEKSYNWLVILLGCIVLVMMLIIIFLSLRVAKSLKEEGRKKREESKENADKPDAVDANENVENADVENNAETPIECDEKTDIENNEEVVTSDDESQTVDNEESSAENGNGDVQNEETTSENESAIIENAIDADGVKDAVEVVGTVEIIGTENKKRKTFEDKLNEQDDEFIEYYNTLKDCIMQYEGIKSRSSSGGETFKYKRAVAKLTIDGKTLRLHLALDPNAEKYNDGTCPHKDMSAYESYRDLPFMFKVKSGLALRRAVKLIDDAMEIAGTKKLQ